MDTGERTDGVAVGGDVSPEEAFSHVANETRFDILRALWDARNDGEEPAGFADLRRRSGVRDSGQFNYHLEQLQPRFVRGVEDGYELTFAGQRIIGATVSGVYTHADVTVDPIEVETCPNCDGRVMLGYEDAELLVECEACDLMVTDAAVPPVLVAGHEPEELPLAVSNHLLTQVGRLNHGFCTLCNGRVEREVERTSPGETDTFDDHLTVVYTCTECGNTSMGVVAMALVDHPVVVSFFHDHGIDPRKRPIWELDWWYDVPGRVTGEDPLRIEMSVDIDDETLEMTLDGELDVVEYERY